MLDQQTLHQSPQKLSSTTRPVALEEESGGLGDFADTLGNSFMNEQLAGGGGLLEDAAETVTQAALRLIGGDLGDEEEVCSEDEVPASEEVCANDEEVADTAEEICEEAPESEAEEVCEVAVEELACEGLTPEEQLVAAQEARAGLEAQLTGLDGMQEAERSAILARVNGLEGEALVREMALISHSLESANPDRALNTYADIQAMREDDEDGRLTDDIVEMLVTGVADRRTDSDRGQEGVLNRRNASQSAEALLNMSNADYAATTAMLNSAGLDDDGNAVAGADASVEQSLILKAIASRQERLEGHWYDSIHRLFGGTPDRDVAMSEISGFADDIRGMDRTDLLNQTTTLDIDDANTSTVDPNNIAANNDTLGDNDGLYQRWGDSCGPTTAQIVRGEADPIYALALHRGEGIENAEIDTESATEQQRVLEGNGGVAVSRLGTQAQTNLTTTMNQMQAAGDLDGNERALVNTLLTGGELEGEDQKTAEAALERVRQTSGGSPTEAEIAAMRHNNSRGNGRGMRLDPALNDITSPGTGIDYSVSGVTSGSVGNDLDTIEQRLRDGEDVPFRIGYLNSAGALNGGGHFMSITDVRRESDGTRRFLVTDPWSGATRWVSEADLSSGAFTSNGTFPLGTSRITHTYGED